MSVEPSIRATRILTESVYPWANSVKSTIAQYLYAGDRSRTECLDPVTTGFEIERRDLRRRFRVFVAQKEYQVIPLFDLATDREKANFRYSGRHWRDWTSESRGPVNANRKLTVTVNYEPAPDERLMFGFRARHWIIRRRDEHDRRFGENWTEAVTDAWYFDSGRLSARLAGFSGDLVRHGFCYATSGDEHAVINHSGERPLGICAASETNSVRHIQLPSHEEVRDYTETSSTRVIAIGEVSVPLSFFEPPRRFRKIPVYPSRFTMARLNLSHRLKHVFQVST